MMNNNQKDNMLALILDDIHAQVMKLTVENLLDDAVALYQEWSEQFDESVPDVHVLTINDLTKV